MDDPVRHGESSGLINDRIGVIVVFGQGHVIESVGRRVIIWNGLGFLVGVITFGSLLATEYLVEVWSHDDQYFQAHGWPKLLAFVVAAVIVGVVGRRLGRRQSKVLIDPETGSEVILGRDDSFFFIPIDYWAPILLALGVVFLFVTD